jgi:phosphoglycolate phosphatase
MFDLDGTLIDTIEDITDALNVALASTPSSRVLGVEETIHYVGSGVKELIKRAMPLSASADELQSALDHFMRYYGSRLAVKSRPYPGVIETLNALGAYQKAVISNKQEAMCKAILAQLNMGRFFRLIFGGDAFIEKKPSPMPILETLQRLSIDKRHALMIGDSDHDIEAGKAAGVKTVAVTYGYRRKEKLIGADFMIDAMPELLPIVNSF